MNDDDDHQPDMTPCHMEMGTNTMVAKMVGLCPDVKCVRAIRAGKLDVVKRLRPNPISVPDALLTACRYGRLKIAKYLCSCRYYRIDQQCLANAIIGGHDPTVIWCLKTERPTLSTIVDVVAASAKVRTLELALPYVDFNDPENTGTAILLNILTGACVRGRTDMINTFLRYPEFVHIVDQVDLSKKCFDFDAIDTLIRHGAHPNPHGDNYLLVLAFGCGRSDIAKFMMQDPRVHAMEIPNLDKMMDVVAFPFDWIGLRRAMSHASPVGRLQQRLREYDASMILQLELYQCRDVAQLIGRYLDFS